MEKWIHLNCDGVVKEISLPFAPKIQTTPSKS